MLYIYIVVSIIVILASFGCLRNKFKGLVPVFIVSFMVSAIITAITSVFFFFLSSCNRKEVKEYPVTVNDDGEFESPMWDKDSTEIIECKCVETNKKDSYIEVTNVYRNSNVCHFPILGTIEVKEDYSYVYYLNHKDYELFKTYKNNAH